MASATPVRVLIIDDIKDIADSLKLMLDLLGYETQVAYTGDDGLRVAKEWCPEVVLCDLGLPGVNGYDLAKALRHCPDTAHARLIAISGYACGESRRRATESGFDAHFAKPVDPAALLKVMSSPPTGVPLS